MSFHIGDKVIHWSYGIGEIVGIEEKALGGRPTNCYVFQTLDMTMWIPIDDLSQSSLRIPTQPEEFETLFAILSSPGETLPADRMLRKDQIRAQMKVGQLASICRVIRDLEYFKSSSKLNDQESSLLEQAKRSLLTEWAYSLGVTPVQAQQALIKLLESKPIIPVDTTLTDRRARKSGNAGRPAL
ncbi:MAG: carD [Chloroflexi bacterium]|nr:carD [Chloroflexota bacterium]